jgi:hypothetical protein
MAMRPGGLQVCVTVPPKTLARAMNQPVENEQTPKPHREYNFVNTVIARRRLC